MQAEKFIKRILLKLKQFLGGKRNRDRASAELFFGKGARQKAAALRQAQKKVQTDEVAQKIG